VCLGDSGTPVQNTNECFGSLPSDLDPNGPVGGAQAGGVVEHVLERTRQPLDGALHDRGLAAARELDGRAAAQAMRLDDASEQLCEPNLLDRLLAGCVETAHLLEIAEQLLHAGDLPLHQPGEAALLLGILRVRQHLGGGTDRRERVLELVGDVARKGLHVADVPLEPAPELLQGAGQVADLVPSVLEREATLQPPASIEDHRGLLAQLLERASDGARDQQGEHHRRGQGRQEHPEDAHAHLIEGAQDAEGRLREHDGADHLAFVPDGQRAVEGDGALAPRGDARGRAVAARECGLHLRTGQGATRGVDVGAAVGRLGRGEEAPVEAKGESARTVEPRALLSDVRCRLLLGLASRAEQARVREHLPLRPDDP
jgi:hypothetical protein